MKNKTSSPFATLTLIEILLIVCLFVGCVIKQPAGPPDPITGVVPLVNVPDPRINSLSNSVAGVASAVAPVNPYAGITDYAIKFGFGLAGLVAGYVGQRRNTTAAKDDAAQKQTLLTTVIKGVEDAGAAASAVKTAIQARATTIGVQPQLDALVQKVT